MPDRRHGVRLWGGVVVAGICAWATHLRADVYPSGLTLETQGAGSACGTIQLGYVLNDDADGHRTRPNGITIEVLNGASQVVRTVSIARQNRGRHLFEWDGRRNDGTPAPAGSYRIRVTAADYGYGDWTQISNDANPLVQFANPRGVAVNTRSTSPYYGRIYVSNSLADDTGERPVGDGFYLLNADQSDALGQGHVARTAGLDWDAGGMLSPWRIEVGADDRLYIGDWSDEHGGIFRADPDVADGTGVEVLAGTGETANPEVHGSIGASPIVLGSVETGSLVVYSVDEDLLPRNSLWRWDVNGALPEIQPPTQVTDVLLDTYPSHVDVEVGPDGKIYLMQNRQDGGVPSLYVVSPAGGTILWDSLTASRALLGSQDAADFLKQLRGVKVSPDGRRLAAIMNNSDTWIVPLVQGLPDLAGRVLLDTGSATFGRDVAWDNVGNLYTLSSGDRVLRVFSPPTGDHANSTTSAAFTLSNPPSGGPAISVQPLAASACPGGSASFSVTAPGAGLQWKKNGVAIPGAEGASLLVQPVSAEDDGAVFTVVACTAGGATVSAPAILTVGPSITRPPSNQATCLGGRATFSIEARGSGELIYRWQKNGAELSDGPGVTGAQTASLALSNLTAADDGALVQVLVTDSCGTGAAATSTAAVLRVSGGPEVSTCCSSTILAGQSQQFSAQATALVGTLSYRWQMNGQDLADGVAVCGAEVAGAASALLKLADVPVECSGAEVRVVVTDGCGQVTSSIMTLTVLVPPNETSCTNGRDDDQDGQMDCADTDCALSKVCRCPDPFADMDRDADVDQSDFGVWQACFTGPGGTAPTDPVACDCLDVDAGGLGDGDVDLADLAAFQNCASGPSVPADKACDGR